MKRIYALVDRDKECRRHYFRWTGLIPCTGRLRCYLCGEGKGDQGWAEEDRP